MERAFLQDGISLNLGRIPELHRIAIYPIALIIICILTPDPTIVTSSIWFCTFVALYEVGIILSKRIYKKYVLGYRKSSESSEVK